MTFLWDTVYFRSLSTRLLPIEFEIETLFCLQTLRYSLRQYFTSPETPLLFRFRKGVTRRFSDLTNASLGQMCHLANLSQCCLVFILSMLLNFMKKFISLRNFSHEEIFESLSKIAALFNKKRHQGGKFTLSLQNLYDKRLFR